MLIIKYFHKSILETTNLLYKQQIKLNSPSELSFQIECNEYKVFLQGFSPSTWSAPIIYETEEKMTFWN